MNEHVTTTRQTRAPTQAAEGLPRWRWTTAELERCVAAGVIDPDERLELIGGEIVPMSPAGEKHEDVADELAQLWVPPLRPADVRISVERQFNLDELTYTMPDIVVRPAGVSSYRVRGNTALLVIEVADSSWEKDTGAKARIYAAFGVREYWVIDAETLSTRVHLEPSASGFGRVIDVPPTDVLLPHLVPGLAVKLAALNLPR